MSEPVQFELHFDGKVWFVTAERVEINDAADIVGPYTIDGMTQEYASVGTSTLTITAHSATVTVKDLASPPASVK